jgi:hypothetical protein
VIAVRLCCAVGCSGPVFVSSVNRHTTSAFHPKIPIINIFSLILFFSSLLLRHNYLPASLVGFHCLTLMLCRFGLLLNTIHSHALLYSSSVVVFAEQAFDPAPSHLYLPILLDFRYTWDRINQRVESIHHTLLFTVRPFFSGSPIELSTTLPHYGPGTFNDSDRCCLVNIGCPTVPSIQISGSF